MPFNAIFGPVDGQDGFGQFAVARIADAQWVLDWVSVGLLLCSLISLLVVGILGC